MIFHQTNILISFPNSQEAEFKTLERIIREQDLDVQEKLIGFCKYLNENEKKKKRANERYDAVLADSEEKDKNIMKLKDDIEILEKDKKKISQKKVQLMKYADFLEKFRVKNHDGDNYGDIIDILDRYKILSKSKKQLTSWWVSIARPTKSISISRISKFSNRTKTNS